MIKAVIFDYGGVVTSGGKAQSLSGSLSKVMGISIDESDSIMFEPWNKLLRGQINTAQFWQEAEDNFGKPIDEKYRDIFSTWDDMQPRPEIVEFIKSLQAHGHITGLLSNIIEHTKAIINDNNGYNLFKPLILSCEVGYAKPDKQVYEMVLQSLDNVQPEEILFIDDQAKYANPAKDFGFQVIISSDSDRIIKKAKQILAKA